MFVAGRRFPTTWCSPAGESGNTWNSLGFVDEDFRKVHFIPFVPYEELPKLYNLAEMSVMPAYYDGCSTTMMESMACGCPVVASKTAAGPEIGGDGALYADPHDPADFADKIRSLANDEDLTDRDEEEMPGAGGIFQLETNGAGDPRRIGARRRLEHVRNLRIYNP